MDRRRLLTGMGAVAVASRRRGSFSSTGESIRVVELRTDLQVAPVGCEAARFKHEFVLADTMVGRLVAVATGVLNISLDGVAHGPEPGSNRVFGGVPAVVIPVRLDNGPHVLSCLVDQHLLHSRHGRRLVAQYSRVGS